MQKFLLLKVYYNTEYIYRQVNDLALQVLLPDCIFIKTTAFWFFVLLWLNRATILDPDLICFDIIA